MTHLRTDNIRHTQSPKYKSDLDKSLPKKRTSSEMQTKLNLPHKTFRERTAVRVIAGIFSLGISEIALGIYTAYKNNQTYKAAIKIIQNNHSDEVILYTHVRLLVKANPKLDAQQIVTKLRSDLEYN